MNKKGKKLGRVGKAHGAFWPGRDTGGEPVSCRGGQENSTVLQGACVFRLSLEEVTEGEAEVTLASEGNRESSVGVVGGEKENERARQQGRAAAAVARREKTMPRALRPAASKTTLYRGISHARSPIFG